MSHLPETNINHLIPQKEPFVLVDTLLEYSENHLVSLFTVPETHVLSNGNMFTEPGVIEHMAQSVALHTGYAYFLKGEPAPVGYIGSIKRVSVMTLPQVNSKITTKVDILHEFAGVTMVDVNVFNEAGDAIASGQMKTVIANED